MGLRKRESRGNPARCGGFSLLFIRIGERKPLALSERARRGAEKERRGSEKAADGGWQHTASPELFTVDVQP